MSQTLPITDAPIETGAGFWIRALARIIDIAYGNLLGLASGIFGGIILVLLEITGLVLPGWEERIQGISPLGFVLSVLGGILYHTFCEGIHGATIGKLICQIRVVNQDGLPSNMKGAFIRSIGWMIDSLFIGLVGLFAMQRTPLKQRYGDVWGKTLVIRKRDLSATSERPAIRFIAGFIAGSASWSLLLVLSVIMRAIQ